MNSDLRIGTWLVQPDRNLISGNGRRRQLEPKVMDVLICMAHRPGETLTKEQLMKTVWPNTFVTDHVLVRSICEIRRAFDDDARESKFIQTISKRGYRLVAPVESVNRELPVTDEAFQTSRSGVVSILSKRGLRIGLLLGGTATVALLAILVVIPTDLWRKLVEKPDIPQICSLAALPACGH